MLQSVPLSSLFAVLVLGLLSGCGADEGAAKPASQVAVKVNKDEISVHQLNTLLMRSDPVPPEMLKQAGTAALERLIDQQLLVQQAKERKLERDPKVMQAIEVARREILARSYVEQVVGIDPSRWWVSINVRPRRRSALITPITRGCFRSGGCTTCRN